MKYKSVLLILLLFVSIAVSIPNIISDQTVLFNYKTMQFENRTYDYYTNVYQSDWLVIYFPGGEYHATGNWTYDWLSGGTIPMLDSWIALAYMMEGAKKGLRLDFLEPQRYELHYNEHGWWIAKLIAHMRDDYKYKFVILAGISAGGSVAASLAAWWGEDAKGRVDAFAIYAGPTAWRIDGVVGSSTHAKDVAIPTFLSYGLNDTAVSWTEGQIYAINMRDEIPRLFVVTQGEHTSLLVTDTLPLLFGFIVEYVVPEFTKENLAAILLIVIAFLITYRKILDKIKYKVVLNK